MMEELLAKHVFGKVLPSEIVARLERLIAGEAEAFLPFAKLGST